MLVTVQRLPSHYSLLTTNSSRRVSITAGLAFIFPTPPASSHPSFWLLLTQSAARRRLDVLRQLRSNSKARSKKGRANVTSSVTEIGGTHQRVGHDGGSFQNNFCSPSSKLHAQRTAKKGFLKKTSGGTDGTECARSYEAALWPLRWASFGTGPLDPIGKNKRCLCVF